MIGKPNSSKDRTRANVCKDIITMALIWSTTILLLNSSYDFSSKSLSGVTIIHCLPIHHAKNTTIRSDCAREEPPCRISGLASLPSNISLVLFFVLESNSGQNIIEMQIYSAMWYRWDVSILLERKDAHQKLWESLALQLGSNLWQIWVEVRAGALFFDS